MIEPERWHWCDTCCDSTLQVVELVQELPFWACSECGVISPLSADSESSMPSAEET